MTRPSNEALWVCIEDTLRDVILPSLTDEFARVSAAQLVGLAEYARRRGDDPGDPRSIELAGILDDMASNAIVTEYWPADDLSACLSAILVAALTRSDPDGDEVRQRLRPVVVAHLDRDLSASSVLGRPFRGGLNAR